MSSVEFVKLDETATLPTLDGEKDFIFYSNEVQTIPKNTLRKIKCGVVLSETSKSSIFKIETDETNTFETCQGVFGGSETPRELAVHIINNSENDITINVGDKIGKLVRVV